jgi:hypothetical protein
MCFVWIWEQTAIISLYSINWLVFITETECVILVYNFLYFVLSVMVYYGHLDRLPEAFFLGTSILKIAAVSVDESRERSNESKIFFAKDQSMDTHHSRNLKTLTPQTNSSCIHFFILDIIRLRTSTKRASRRQIHTFLCRMRFLVKWNPPEVLGERKSQWCGWKK